MEDVWIKVFTSVAAGIILMVITGVVLFRDKLRDHDKCLKNDSEDIKDLLAKFKELKDIYNVDRVERNSLMTMATSIDTKIDAKLKDVLAEIAEQRRQDTAMFSQAVSDLNATLGKVNVTLEYMSKDIDGIKRGGK